MESKQYLESELETIRKWEKEQKDVFFWEKIGRIPFMLLDRLTPKIVRDKVGEGLNELGKFIQTGGKYLVRKKSVLIILTETSTRGRAGMLDSIEAEHSAANRKTEEDLKGRVDQSAEEVLTLEEASKLPISIMDMASDGIIAKRVKFAAAQGAATGIGGVFTMAADIPLVLGQSLKVLQEMALCYGYDPDDPKERVFIVKCLQFSSADIVGKKAVLEELAAFDDANQSDQVFSQIQGWREVVQSYTDSFGMKKLFQLIPIAGIIFGSVSNKGTIGDAAEAGKMLYKKRRISQRLGNNEFLH